MNDTAEAVITWRDGAAPCRKLRTATIESIPGFVLTTNLDIELDRAPPIRYLLRDLKL